MWTALFKLLPLKDWVYLVAAIVLCTFVVVFVEHERAVGREEIQQQIDASIQKAQEKINVSAPQQNAAIDKQYSVLEQALGGPLDYRVPACGRADDDVVLRVNAAHKAGGR